jgi:ribonuclease Y
MSEEHEPQEGDREGADAADDEGGEERSIPETETEAAIEQVDTGSEQVATADGETDAEGEVMDGVATETEAGGDAGRAQQSDEAAKLETLAQRLDQREMGLDSRAEKLDEREDRLDEREQDLIDQREALAEKRTALEEREAAIETRETELQEREAAIETREAELKEYAAELDDRDQTLREYVGDQVGESVEGVIVSALEDHAENTPHSRFGPTGGLVLGLFGLTLVVGGVANALATETGAFSAALGSTTGNVVLSAVLILVGLTGNLAAATDRV